MSASWWSEWTRDGETMVPPTSERLPQPQERDQRVVTAEDVRRYWDDIRVAVLAGYSVRVAINTFFRAVVKLEDDALAALLASDRPLLEYVTGRGIDEAPAVTKGYVYHLYGWGMDLLYIGSTSDVEKRISEHKRDKSWWREVTYVRWMQYPNTAMARAVEETLIRLKLPRYNKVYR